MIFIYTLLHNYSVCRGKTDVSKLWARRVCLPLSFYRRHFLFRMTWFFYFLCARTDKVFRICCNSQLLTIRVIVTSTNLFPQVLIVCFINLQSAIGTFKLRLFLEQWTVLLDGTKLNHDRPCCREINVLVYVHVKPSRHACRVRKVLGQDLWSGRERKNVCNW